ncbi:hypothetical protein K504DRAFT_532084 [Pleomassaria siparia CBS 279.74]|uniref:Myb-like domain-containing protein n=1 Tax=Pleomassaria siparia CBS 279.74 TaxID=1314801 RepID=A0A6G1KGG2_9PLEO|nr:hypothetical protein K504DRAFT_532084 [Pleomassaria siparia CBS 279.74]
MSDNEVDTGKSAGKGWTDRERLVYLVAIMENSPISKADINAAPRPLGRTAIACERMIGRLKASYKDDLEALKAGKPMVHGDGEATSKTPRTPKTPKTPRTPKRKANDPEGGDDTAGASPKKRGRSKKEVDTAVKDEVEDHHLIADI